MIFASQKGALASLAGLGKGNEQDLLIKQTTEKPPFPQSINGLAAHREDRGVDCLIWRAGVLNTWSSPNCASPHAEASWPWCKPIGCKRNWSKHTLAFPSR
ncbi:Hypothetical protein PMT_2659 [Prochlorococcus marinus str. MIT 9313]|uniref:Uncharacterized protein n=1 Tax=Prochlorococcus marinus (strain MIT 9313) TaxID=74547 RepID=B9ES44_PROMM|nr:Hypothetical protein PMT_2659 [Prochlorococcus marinus str. MIT 9313]